MATYKLPSVVPITSKGKIEIEVGTGESEIQKQGDNKAIPQFVLGGDFERIDAIFKGSTSDDSALQIARKILEEHNKKEK